MILKDDDGDCLWDRMPRWLKVATVVGGTIYFGGGLIAPFFWNL